VAANVDSSSSQISDTTDERQWAARHGPYPRRIKTAAATVRILIFLSAGLLSRIAVCKSLALIVSVSPLLLGFRSISHQAQGRDDHASDRQHPVSHYVGDEQDPTGDYENQRKKPYRHLEARPPLIPQIARHIYLTHHDIWT
jgi:hypothetical protein